MRRRRYLVDDEAKERDESEEGEKPYEEIPLHLRRGAHDKVEAAAIFERLGCTELPAETRALRSAHLPLACRDF